MKMNTVKTIMCVFLLGTGFSCEDYLDKQPDDFLTLEKVFEDKSRVEEWLAAIYSGVPENYDNIMRCFDAFADDLAPSLGWAAYGWISSLDLQKGNWDATRAFEQRDRYWITLPRRIRSAYILMERIHPVEGLPQEEVDYMKAEARFLIAYFNSLRLTVWGAIPVQEGLANLEDPLDEMMIGQKPFDEVVELIDAELKAAAEILPPLYSDAKKYGRATSIMCHAVRARLLLFAASPLVNGNTYYANYVNDKGQTIFNQTPDATKWRRAADACKELIDLAHLNGHALYKEYKDGEIDPFLSYQNMLFTTYNNGNKEILFARAWGRTEVYDSRATPRGTAGNGGLGVTQTLVDAFFMKNGLPAITGYNADGSPIINAASGYSESSFSTGTTSAKTSWIEGASGANKANPTNVITQTGTYMMYVDREPRFYISVLYNGAWYRRENRSTTFYSNTYDGGPTHDAPSYGYLVRKKVHPDYDPRNKVNPYRPCVLYRLGEAYLNYAEALNECDPGNPDILVYLNEIRKRAGIPTYGTSAGEIAPPAGKAAMREAIWRERRVELNCENGTRWDDVRRWMIGEEALTGTFYGMNFSGTVKSDDKNNPAAYFVRSYVMDRSFTKRSYWMPIPQTEIDKNLNLRQLPGW
jgi:hypothetical protein